MRFNGVDSILSPINYLQQQDMPTRNKKYIFLLFFIYGIYSEAASQISAGVHAGVGLFTFHQYEEIEEVDKLLFRNGLFLGVPIEMKIKNNLYFHVEPSFIRKGVVANWSNRTSGNYEYDHKEYQMDYVGSSFMMKYLIPIKERGFFIGSGFDFGYLMQGKIIQYSGSFIGGTGDPHIIHFTEIEKTPDYKISRTDFSWVVDFSLPTETRIGTFVAGIKGMMDFTPWRNFHMQRPVHEDKIKNWGFIIYGGYMIPDGNNSRYKNKDGESF